MKLILLSVFLFFGCSDLVLLYPGFNEKTLAQEDVTFCVGMVQITIRHFGLINGSHDPEIAFTFENLSEEQMVKVEMAKIYVVTELDTLAPKFCDYGGYANTRYPLKTLSVPPDSKREFNLLFSKTVARNLPNFYVMINGVSVDGKPLSISPFSYSRSFVRQ